MLPDRCGRCPLAQSCSTKEEIADACLDVKHSLQELTDCDGSNRRISHQARHNVIQMLKPHRAQLIMIPCEETCAGGDGVDVFTSEGEIGAFVYDVNGHSTPAALERPMMLGMFQDARNDSMQSGRLDLLDIATRYNQKLLYHEKEWLPRMEGVLVAIARLQRTLEACAFGGMTAFYKTKNDVQELVPKDTQEAWFGVHEFENLNSIKRKYTSGDSFLICSDGFPLELKDELFREFRDDNMHGVQSLINREHPEKKDDVTALCVTLQ